MIKLVTDTEKRLQLVIDVETIEEFEDVYRRIKKVMAE